MSSLSSVCKITPAQSSFTELSRIGDVAEIAALPQLLTYQMEWSGKKKQYIQASWVLKVML